MTRIDANIIFSLIFINKNSIENDIFFMAGIFRHFIIACILSMTVFILFWSRINAFSLLFFILGNVIPDMVFIPSFVVKYKTLNAEKITRTRAWEVLSRYDEIIMFLIAIGYLLVLPSLEIAMLLIGVVVHIYIDKFMFEENVWW